MILRLPNNVLFHHAVNIFTARTISPKSWFAQIRNLCLFYGLPHPAKLIECPPSKESFKTMVKKKVIDYWEQELRSQAKSLTSLKYFNPEFMSLNQTHPIFSTAGPLPYQVSMATVQAVMVSGRYHCDSLLQHWSSKISGECVLPTCINSNLLDDLEHILQLCPSMQPTRDKLRDFTREYLVKNALPISIQSIVNSFCSPQSIKFCQFLIDCSSLPCVIEAIQMYGDGIIQHFFTITRTWIFSLHRERLKLRGEWRRGTY